MSGIKGEVRGASETLRIMNLKKICQAKKSEIYYESAEESWAVAYKELSYSQSSSSSSAMSSFFQDGMQEPFQESVSFSLTSVSLYFIALKQPPNLFSIRETG